MSGFLLERNLRGGETIDHWFFKTIGYCFYCSFYYFLKILGEQRVAPPGSIAYFTRVRLA